MLSKRLAAALLLLGAFFIASYHLQRESLWHDEGWTLWAVRDEGPPPRSALEALQFVRASFSQTLERVRGDVHPPLYFVLLDGWTLLTGESVFAVRLFSALCGLLGLAAVYAVGKRLFDHQTGLLALALLATASFFVYYTREARMYALLCALSALSALVYLRWLARPTARRTALYALVIALTLYTHYAGALVIAAQGLHLLAGLLARWQRWRVGIIWPYVGGGLLFAPGAAALFSQIRAHNGRPLADALPPEWWTILPLLLILTSGYWGLFALPFVLGRALPAARRWFSALLLLVLWLALTPLALLLLNMTLTPVFQIRYNIAVLPAGALLIAYALRQVHLPGTAGRFSGALRLFLLVWLVYTQLAMYTEFWPDKPRWQAAIAQMTRARDPLVPAVTDINPSSPAAYYDRLLGIRRGIALDLSWREDTPQETARIAGRLQNAPSVWAVLRTDRPSTWDMVALLQEGRGVAYRDSVMNVIFYRFDADAQSALRFRFGDVLAYESGIGHQFYARAGEAFCPPLDLRLTALKTLDEGWAAGLALTQGYNTLRARVDMPLNPADPGGDIALRPCLSVPPDTPPGPHHLRLVVYHQHDGQRLPLVEDETLYWGTELMLAVAHIAASE